MVIQGCFLKKFTQSVCKFVFQSVPHFNHVPSVSTEILIPKHIENPRNSRDGLLKDYLLKGLCDVLEALYLFVDYEMMFTCYLR